MKPRLMGTLKFNKSSDANTFESSLATLADRVNVNNEKSMVSREGDNINFSLFFNNMVQIQRLRTWVKDRNLKGKLRAAVSEENISFLTFHKCMHDEGLPCKEFTIVI